MKLLLVDGYALLYRAFFSSPPLTTKDGQPTGALFGFSKMLFRLLDEARPEYALVALDASAPTFRHDSYAEYKANRAVAPDDLKIQTKLVRDLLDGLSIPRYERAGYEGDDVLGTLAALGVRSGADVTIVTGDGDALQLVSDQVQVLLTRRGVSDLQCFTPAAVRERFGFDPLLVPDYKGLRGDSSDNIPGVPGIGEKTAMSLISRFGALENLYEKLDEVTPPRIRDLLVQHREVAFQSRDLARIVVDLPLDIDFEACRYQAYQDLDEERRAKAMTTIHTFEFKSLLGRYEAGSSGPGTNAPEAETPTEQVFELQQASDAVEVKQWLQAHCAPQESVALLLDAEQGAVLACGEAALYLAGDIAQLREWIEDVDHPKIVHDAKAVKLALALRDLELRGVVADTMLMGYLLDPTRQHHPPALLATKYLNRSLPTVEPVKASSGGKGKKAAKAAPTSLFADDDEPAHQAEAEAAPEQQEHEAARQRVLAATACVLCALRPVLRHELQRIGEAKLFDQIELPLVDVLVSMEQSGMLLDESQLHQLGQQLQADAERSEAEIWELAGEKFNIGSTRQLQVILFEKLGLAKGRAIKSGHSTDVHTLEKLAEKHDIVRKILEYRATTKLKSTYIDALLNGMDPQTHRIHTNLNQTGTVSGRLSSSDPNLQNVPIRTPQGRLIRKAFIAPPGHVLITADYSQIELRILAHITGDEPLVEAFKSGQDVHARTAADLFRVPVEAVDSEMRRKAKMTNYAIAYGVSGFGLAKQLGMESAGEAQQFINRYFEALPGVQGYINDTLQTARTQGYVETLMGRRRPLPEINSPRGPERAGAERTAINHPIQGTSADIMKLAMLAIDEEMRRAGLRARMTMQVHDELVFEVPDEEVPILSQLIERLMCEVPGEALHLRVPLDVDVGSGPNWDDTKGGHDPSAAPMDETGE